jgi:hypothetical protein
MSYAKALVAAAIGGIGSLATAAQSGGITLAEALTAAGVMLVAFQGTYWVSNTPTLARQAEMQRNLDIANRIGRVGDVGDR